MFIDGFLDYGGDDGKNRLFDREPDSLFEKLANIGSECTRDNLENGFVTVVGCECEMALFSSKSLVYNQLGSEEVNIVAPKLDSRCLEIL